MRYRRITTTGQIREKKKERRQSIYVWLIVIVILAILVGVGYLATPTSIAPANCISGYQLSPTHGIRDAFHRHFCHCYWHTTGRQIHKIWILPEDHRLWHCHRDAFSRYGYQSVTEYESLVSK